MESIIDKAKKWVRAISESTKDLTPGNVAHKSCAIRGMADRSAEYLEKHKEDLSVIKWETGKPREEGFYIVTLEDGSVVENCWDEITERWAFFSYYVVAWCKISDIKPYKE